jgi:hypothetical protein
LYNIGEIDSHTKVLCTALKCLQFGFAIFWRKDFGAKAAHKMLVKLTPALHLQNWWIQKCRRQDLNISSRMNLQFKQMKEKLRIEDLAKISNKSEETLHVKRMQKIIEIKRDCCKC